MARQSVRTQDPTKYRAVTAATEEEGEAAGLTDVCTRDAARGNIEHLICVHWSTIYGGVSV